MILVIDTDNYSDDYLILSEKVRNTVMENSSFTRLSYSAPDVSFNGLFLKVTIRNMQIEQHYNKYKCVFQTFPNTQVIKSLTEIERRILDCYRTDKAKISNIREQLMTGSIKIFTYEKDVSLITLKISGIWENETSCGLTFKFISD
jgi:hypothetical protein